MICSFFKYLADRSYGLAYPTGCHVRLSVCGIVTKHAGVSSLLLAYKSMTVNNYTCRVFHYT